METQPPQVPTPSPGPSPRSLAPSPFGLKPEGEKGGKPGVVTDDIPCLKCQYNLRTLPVDGRCPECGTEVRETLWCRLPNARPLRNAMRLMHIEFILGATAWLTFLTMVIPLALWPVIRVWMWVAGYLLRRAALGTGVEEVRGPVSVFWWTTILGAVADVLTLAGIPPTMHGGGPDSFWYFAAPVIASIPLALARTMAYVFILRAICARLGVGLTQAAFTTGVTLMGVGTAAALLGLFAPGELGALTGLGLMAFVAGWLTVVVSSLVLTWPISRIYKAPAT